MNIEEKAKLLEETVKERARLYMFDRPICWKEALEYSASQCCGDLWEYRISEFVGIAPNNENAHFYIVRYNG